MFAKCKFTKCSFKVLTLDSITSKGLLLTKNTDLMKSSSSSSINQLQFYIKFHIHTEHRNQVFCQQQLRSCRFYVTLQHLNTKSSYFPHPKVETVTLDLIEVAIEFGIFIFCREYSEEVIKFSTVKKGLHIFLITTLLGNTQRQLLVQLLKVNQQLLHQTVFRFVHFY